MCPQAKKQGFKCEASKVRKNFMSLEKPIENRGSNGNLARKVGVISETNMGMIT
jgi:hypothetical protein